MTVSEPTGVGPRVGLGFDVHPTQPGRALWLAGVRFEGEDGLSGHSDGDVVCHAIADALLGSAALGDLGQHFPETDPDVEGIGGADVLRRVAALVRSAGFAPASTDAADFVGDSVHVSTQNIVDTSILKPSGAIKVPRRDAYP